jgi:hypothetical protein
LLNTFFIVKEPEIPYRAHTEEERRAFWDYARTLGEGQDHFWKQTQHAARERANLLRSRGYVLTNPFEFGGAMDGYGENCLVLPKGSDPRSRDVRQNEIAVLRLWESGGFLTEPLQLSIDHTRGKAHIDAGVELRNYLIQKNIPFWEQPKQALLQRQTDLRAEIDHLAYLIASLR